MAEVGAGTGTGTGTKPRRALDWQQAACRPRSDPGGIGYCSSTAPHRGRAEPGTYELTCPHSPQLLPPSLEFLARRTRSCLPQIYGTCTTAQRACTHLL